MSDLPEPEHAIALHLRVERTQPVRTPKDYKPQPLAFSARFSADIIRLQIMYVGIQYLQGTDPGSAIATVEAAFGLADGPKHWDRARYQDEAGYWNDVMAAYWDDRDTHGRWNDRLPTGWWKQGLDLNGKIGAFREVYTPGAADFETTFSHSDPEGLSNLSERMFRSQPNAYFGAARDRLPRAQTDALEPVGIPQRELIGVPPLAAMRASRDTRGLFITVKPHDNLCLLRSGQDWSQAEGEERAFYLETIKPSLDRGMTEIRDDGRSLGCYFNRYMTVLENGVPVEKSYSVSAWHSFADPEKWVKTPTHLAIFGPWITHLTQASKQNAEVNIRLYHEMMVLKADDQSFSYFNCHDRTGMLNAITDLST